MTTTAGSLALEGSVAQRDAHVAARLRAAGAVIRGKTNLSEWANFRSTRSVSGWSARGGQCRNPYALDRNPCGSSSGSGVAVAANLAPLAVGTETDGSILSPASVNGLVGIKPTVGLVSRSGIVPISATQDTAGPRARTVAAAAALLTALAGEDPRDPETAAGRGRAADYTSALWEDSLTVKNNELFYNYQVYNQAIVVPETIDAVRALTGIDKDGMKSIAKTDKAMGVVRDFLAREHELA